LKPEPVWFMGFGSPVPTTLCCAACAVVVYGSNLAIHDCDLLALFATAAAFNSPASLAGHSMARAQGVSVQRAGSAIVMEEVEDKVKGIIAEQLGVELDSVTPAASFTEDLGADSLDAVELIMAIEEAFDIEIPDEEAETMTTPADCVTAIKAKI